MGLDRVSTENLAPSLAALASAGNADALHQHPFAGVLSPPRRPYIPQANWAWREPFNVTSGWTASNADLSVDAVNGLCADASGYGALKITPSAGSTTSASIRKDISSVNAANKFLVATVYFPTVAEGNTDVDSHLYVEFNLFTTYGGDYVYARTKPVNYTSAGDGLSGWYTFEVPVDSMVVNGAGATLTDITHFRIIIAHSNGTKPQVVVAHAGIYASPWSGGAFLVRADIPAYLVYALQGLGYANELGVPATWGLAPYAIDGATAGYATAPQVRAMAQRVELATYVQSHDAAIPNLWDDRTRDQKIAQLEYARESARSKGLPEAACRRLLLTGGTGWNAADRETIIGRYADYASGSEYWNGPTNVIIGPMQVATGYLPWAGFINVPGSGAAPAWLAGAITVAADSKGLLVLGTHCATANERASLRASIDAMLAGGLRPVRWDDLAGGW